MAEYNRTGSAKSNPTLGPMGDATLGLFTRHSPKLHRQRPSGLYIQPRPNPPDILHSVAISPVLQIHGRHSDGQAPASSWHTGGVMVLLADGSVRFVFTNFWVEQTSSKGSSCQEIATITKFKVGVSKNEFTIDLNP